MAREEARERLFAHAAPGVFDHVVDRLTAGGLLEATGVLALSGHRVTLSDDESVARWCTRMSRLIVAEIYRREYIQVAIDAKAAAIEAEERRLACETRPAPVLRTVLPSSAV